MTRLIYDARKARDALGALYLRAPFLHSKEDIFVAFETWMAKHEDFAVLYDAVLALGFARLLNGDEIPGTLRQFDQALRRALFAEPRDFEQALEELVALDPRSYSAWFAQFRPSRPPRTRWPRSALPANHR